MLTFMHLRMNNAQHLLFTGITGLQEKPNLVNPSPWHSSLGSCCLGVLFVVLKCQNTSQS